MLKTSQIKRVSKLQVDALKAAGVKPSERGSNAQISKIQEHTAKVNYGGEKMHSSPLWRRHALLGEQCGERQKVHAVLVHG
jgi:hypothetical protein